MPRKKCYGSEAEKQRAYRLRKAGLVLVEKEAVADTATVETRENSSGAGAEPIDGASAAHAIPEGRTVGSNPATGVSLNNLPVPVVAEPVPYPLRRGSKLSTEQNGKAIENQEVRQDTVDQSAIHTPNSIGGQKLSCTDQKFEEDRPTWYIFGKVEKEKNCWKCGKKFSTRLEMNKFCSPNCKNEYLDTAFTKLRSQ